MEEWHANIAKNFKQRDNPKPMGNILGKVVSTGANWLVTIKDGKFKIDASNGYICNQLLEHKATYEYSHSGNITTVGCHAGPDAPYKAKGSGHIKIHPIWKVGDYVMVSPDERGQHYFIVDIVRI